MKITGIKTLVVNARMRNWVLVKVETDQPGLYGWGEATLEWKTKGVVGSIEDLSVLLIGQDPRRVEHLWQMMHRQYFWRGGITNYTRDERHRPGAVGHQGQGSRQAGLRTARRTGA